MAAKFRSIYVAVLCVYPHLHDSAGAEIQLPAEDRALVEATWSSIKKALPDDMPEWDTAKRDTLVKWEQAESDARNALSLALRHPNRRFILHELVFKFGSEGARPDYAWLLAFSNLAVNTGSGGGLYKRRNFHTARLREIQLEVAEAQVRLFISNDTARDRYVHMLLWGGWLNKDVKLINMKRYAIESIGTDEYWFRARDFLVLHTLTGGVGHLREVEPGKLAVEAQAWSNRLTQINIPEVKSLAKPFPDWDRAQPIPGLKIGEY